MKKIAILGFGNPVRGDDAVGCLVIEKLKQNNFKNKNEISLYDMGTNGFEVLFALKGHSKIILIDAVKTTGEKIGTIYKLPAEEILAAPQDDPILFLHGMKWNQGLSYAKKIMGAEYPKDIQVYLISIENTSLVEKITTEALNAVDQVVELISKELENDCD